MLGAIMSEFGSKIPVIGDFIKGYGDITVEFVKTINGLHTRIQSNIRQGHMGPWLGGAAETAWNQQGLGATVAYRKAGYRYVYCPVETDFPVYVWDEASLRTIKGVFGETKKLKGRWWRLDDPKVFPTPISLSELENRFKRYLKAGNKNPTAQQILFGNRKAVEIRLTAPNLDPKMPGKGPEQTIIIKAEAIRITNEEVMKTAELEVYELANPEVKFPCKSGRPIKIRLPKEKGEYHLRAELNEASKQALLQLAPGDLKVWVGTETAIKLVVPTTEMTIEEKSPVSFKFSLMTVEGDPVDGGDLSIQDIEGGEFQFTYKFGDELQERFFDNQWIPYQSVPLESGLRTVAINYSGVVRGVGRKRAYILPCKTSASFKVFEAVESRLKTNVGYDPDTEKWWLQCDVSDPEGAIVSKGEIRFLCLKGQFENDKKKSQELTIKDPAKRVYWTHPSEVTVENPTIITVEYLGFESEEMLRHLPASESLILPRIEERKTKLNVITKDDKNGSLTHTLQIDLRDEQNLYVESGSLQVQCDAGHFWKTSNRSGIHCHWTQRYPSIGSNPQT